MVINDVLRPLIIFYGVIYDVKLISKGYDHMEDWQIKLDQSKNKLKKKIKTTQGLN
jgi:hypothetical protein